MENIKESLEKAINELQKEYGITHYDEETQTLTNMSEEEKHKIASEAMDILFNEK